MVAALRAKYFLPLFALPATFIPDVFFVCIVDNTFWVYFIHSFHSFFGFSPIFSLFLTPSSRSCLASIFSPLLLLHSLVVSHHPLCRGPSHFLARYRSMPRPLAASFLSVYGLSIHYLGMTFTRSRVAYLGNSSVFDTTESWCESQTIEEMYKRDDE